MLDSTVPPPLDELLARREWVRRFARTLARDDATADDLAQDAMLAAIERPPQRADAPAGWLRRVTLRLAMNRARAVRRRESRETAASRAVASPATDDVVAAAESHRRVVEAVLALDEPYRTTILLRFFEDLPPRDVATRMGVPVETVRSRVRRAVEQLRTRLDDDHGGRRAAWLAPLLASGITDAPRVPIAAPAAGVMAMTTAQKAAVAVLTLLLLGAGAAVTLLPDGDAPAPRETARDDADVPAAQRRARNRAERPAGEAVTEAAPAGERVAATETPPADLLTRDVIVRVVDSQGAPVSGVRVHLNVTGGPRNYSPIEISDAEGRTKFRATADEASAWAEGEGLDGRAWRRKRSTVHVAANATTVDLVVVAQDWIRGRVVGEDGKPIYQAEIRALADGRSVWSQWSDSRGEFKIAVPPGGTYDVALCGMIGGRPRNDQFPELVAEVAGVAAGAKDVELVAKPATGKGRVRVRTVTSDGRPLAGVRVIVSTPTDWNPYGFAPTDADGLLVVDDVPDRRVRVAVETKFGESPPWEADGWVTPTGELLVRPGDAEVRLVFEAGRPLRGRVEYPEDYPRQPRPGPPQSYVVVEEDGRSVAGGYSDANQRFSVLVPARCRGPFRLVCGVSGEVEGRHRDFHAEAEDVPADAQDVVLKVVERKL
jgi:RNA polymerase sigma factor (sigma-70 family)